MAPTQTFRVPSPETPFSDPAAPLTLPLESPLSCSNNTRQMQDILIFFPITNESHNDNITELLRTSLAHTLTRFRHLAGSLLTSPAPGAYHVNISSSDSISFSVQRCDDDIPPYSEWLASDFAQHLINPDQLLPDLPIITSTGQQPALAVQLTFTRGVLIVGLAWHSNVSDVAGIATFLQDWAATSSRGWTGRPKEKLPVSDFTPYHSLSGGTASTVNGTTAAVDPGALILPTPPAAEEDTTKTLSVITRPRPAALRRNNTSTFSTTTRNVMWHFSERSLSELTNQTNNGEKKVAAVLGLLWRCVTRAQLSAVYGNPRSQSYLLLDTPIPSSSAVAGGRGGQQYAGNNRGRVFISTEKLENRELLGDNGIPRAIEAQHTQAVLHSDSQGGEFANFGVIRVDDWSDMTELYDLDFGCLPRPQRVRRGRVSSGGGGGGGGTTTSITLLPRSGAQSDGKGTGVNFGHERNGYGAMNGHDRRRDGDDDGLEVLISLRSKHMGELLRDPEIHRFATPRGTPAEHNPQDP
ncbi:transferase family-domain-containing protein [Diplogelasinospora grovesii]|uniref:Transferase family-domain-containing protein n=1 Tax=Diplogelasinospora grovesii TaxID=303347 RepID=A0AAN6NE16_9PEZI|nr:transferase family-domain-containing protein [Diplogelasinospora grovesii]